MRHELRVPVDLRPESGLHSGCRLRFDDDGYIHVSTGDAAVGTHPLDLSSLGGGQLISPAGVTLVRTGTAVTVLVRNTGDRVLLRRSVDDGTSWAAPTATPTSVP